MRLLPNNTARLFAPEYPGRDLYMHAVGYDDFIDPAITPIRHLRTYNDFTLHFVLSGKGVYTMGGVTRRIEKNCLFFTLPHEPMAYYPDEDDPWEYIYFNFSGEQAQALCAEMLLTKEQPVRYDIPHAAVKRLLERMMRDLQDVNAPYYLTLASFYELIHLCRRQPQAKGAAAARYMIDTHYTSPEFTVEHLCRELHISHSHLCRLFKEAYGVSAIRYLIDRRLAQAKQLLAETELPVKAVAYSCGFSDELHFMKTFKAAFGVTARAYRKQL